MSSVPQLPCTHCGTMNPIASSWCRQCGNKLVFDPEIVQLAVASAASNDTDGRWFAYGMSWLPLGVFVLVMGCIVRFSAPALPPAMPPAVPWGPLIPASVTVAVSSVPVANLAPAPSAVGSILDWRTGHGPQILGDLGLDLGVLETHAATVAAAQRSDGSWGSPAATAFATLALQSYPMLTTQIAAERGRAWMLSKRGDWRRWPSPARAMACTALAEADLLPADEVRVMDILLVDGQASPWQFLFLAHQPLGQIPTEWAGLDSDLPIHPLVARRHGRPDGGEAAADKILVLRLNQTLVGERMTAALAAWTSGDEPRALVNWLRDTARIPRSGSDVPAESWAPRAAAMLVGSVPARVPAGWFAGKR